MEATNKIINQDIKIKSRSPLKKNTFSSRSFWFLRHWHRLLGHRLRLLGNNHWNLFFWLLLLNHLRHFKDISSFYLTGTKISRQPNGEQQSSKPSPWHATGSLLQPSTFPSGGLLAAKSLSRTYGRAHAQTSTTSCHRPKRACTNTRWLNAAHSPPHGRQRVKEQSALHQPREQGRTPLYTFSWRSFRLFRLCHWYCLFQCFFLLFLFQDLCLWHHRHFKDISGVQFIVMKRLARQEQTRGQCKH